jgi:hypothetical protein
MVPPRRERVPLQTPENVLRVLKMRYASNVMQRYQSGRRARLMGSRIKAYNSSRCDAEI